MIQVTSLSRRFGPTQALTDVSFAVASGEIVGFLGPNGAGKTTAMRILTATLAPTSGRVEVAGHDVVASPLAARRRIGFMPENVPLYPDGTVDELLRFFALLKNVPPVQIRAELERVTALTGLREVRNRLVGHLSKGYRQRVGMAQALIGDPEILILDEPTAGLDPHQIVEVRELIRGFAGQKCVLLSSHILNEVSLVCQRVLILSRGRLIAEEKPATLARQSGARPKVVLHWDGARQPVLDALAGIAGVAEVQPSAEGAQVVLVDPAPRVRPLLVNAVAAAGGRLQHLSDQAPSLEDLFIDLTADKQKERA